MQITIAATENNERRSGIANLNGIAVNVIGANLTGTDKQIAWAESIMASAIREVANRALNRVSSNGLFDAAALDATIAKINDGLEGIVAKLEGSSATKWIDTRHFGADAIRKIMEG